MKLTYYFYLFLFIGHATCSERRTAPSITDAMVENDDNTSDDHALKMLKTLTDKRTNTNYGDTVKQIALHHRLKGLKYDRDGYVLRTQESTMKKTVIRAIQYCGIVAAVACIFGGTKTDVKWETNQVAYFQACVKYVIHPAAVASYCIAFLYHFIKKRDNALAMQSTTNEHKIDINVDIDDLYQTHIDEAIHKLKKSTVQ
jgi:hypothetical protein